MIDLSVSNLVKSFTIGDNILDGVTFHINQGERVGLLGKNGCGKSTLFKILTGEYDYDEGEISVAPGRRIGLISQIPVYPAGYTVEQVLGSAFQRIHRIQREMGMLAEKMSAGDTSREVLERYDKLNTALELAGGYDTDVQVSKVCNGLGIPEAMRRQQFEQLSGGEQTRVNLGRLILEDTDILLLDEPTNHLELHAVEWLEHYLAGFKGTVLAISHDRYCLDKVVTRVIELNQGKAEFYSGNYSFYAAEKEKRYQEQLKQYEKEQAKIAQLTATATVMHERGTAKMHQRAFAMEKRIERMRTTDRPVNRERALAMQFSSREFNGDELFTVEGLEKAYDSRKLCGTGRPGRRAHRSAGGQRHRENNIFEDIAGRRETGQGLDSLRAQRENGIPASDSTVLQSGAQPGGHYDLGAELLRSGGTGQTWGLSVPGGRCVQAGGGLVRRGKIPAAAVHAHG